MLDFFRTIQSFVFNDCRFNSIPNAEAHCEIRLPLNFNVNLFSFSQPSKFYRRSVKIFSYERADRSNKTIEQVALTFSLLRVTFQRSHKEKSRSRSMYEQSFITSSEGTNNSYYSFQFTENPFPKRNRYLWHE